MQQRGKINWCIYGIYVEDVYVMEATETLPGRREKRKQEIRDRIETVYEQLGILGRTNNSALLTAVTSYGSGRASQCAAA